MRKLAWLFLLWISSTPALALNLGVLSPTGPEDTIEQWGPFATHLADALGEEVNLIPLEAVAGTQAFATGEIDVLIGNPVQAAITVDLMDGVPIASVNRPAGPPLPASSLSGPMDPLKRSKTCDLPGSAHLAGGRRAGSSFRPRIWQTMASKCPVISANRSSDLTKSN